MKFLNRTLAQLLCPKTHQQAFKASHSPHMQDLTLQDAFKPMRSTHTIFEFIHIGLMLSMSTGHALAIIIGKKKKPVAVRIGFELRFKFLDQTFIADDGI